MQQQNETIPTQKIMTIGTGEQNHIGKYSTLT